MTPLLHTHRRNKASLGDPDFFSKFGFLYDGYSPNRDMYWWEFIVMLRKLAVLVVAVLLHDPWYQLMGAVLVVVAAMSLQMLFHPFDAQLFNVLETITLSALFLTQIISLMCVSVSLSPIHPCSTSHASLSALSLIHI